MLKQIEELLDAEAPPLARMADTLTEGYALRSLLGTLHERARTARHAAAG